MPVFGTSRTAEWYRAQTKRRKELIARCMAKGASRRKAEEWASRKMRG